MLRSLLGAQHAHASVAAATATVVELSAPPGGFRLSLLDSCHRKIRLLSGGPVAFLGGLVAKARRKDKEPSTPCPDDPKLYLEEAVVERKLPDIDLRVLVDLPAGLDYNEWLASHTIAFFDHINLVYGTVSEFCTMSGCPDMTAPGLSDLRIDIWMDDFVTCDAKQGTSGIAVVLIVVLISTKSAVKNFKTYLWFDDKGKKTRVAAPQYIDYVMTFTQKTISDESIFPTKYANEFPSSFESIVRKILRLLFHVLAHLYHCHFREVVLLNLHAHLNCVFAHLTLFNHRFQLIEPKETEILQDLEVALRLHADCTATHGSSDEPSSSGTTSEEKQQIPVLEASCEEHMSENESSQEQSSELPTSATGNTLSHDLQSDLILTTNVSEKDMWKDGSRSNEAQQMV